MQRILSILVATIILGGVSRVEAGYEIIYSIGVVGSGTLNGTAFTNGNVYFTIVGDSSNVAVSTDSYGSNVYSNSGTINSEVQVQVSSNMNVGYNLTTTLRVSDDQNVGGGLGQISFMYSNGTTFLSETSTNFTTYNLQPTSTVTTGPATIVTPVTLPEFQGQFILNSINPNTATFSVSTIGLVVPEPASFAMVGLGLATASAGCLASARKRRRGQA